MTRCRPPLRHRGMDESHAQNHDIRTTDRRTEGEGKEEPIKFGAGQRRKARARDGAQPSSALIYANVKLAARTRAPRVEFERPIPARSLNHLLYQSRIQQLDMPAVLDRNDSDPSSPDLFFLSFFR